MYFIGGSNSPNSAPGIASGHYLVLYKINSWESNPRARGSTLENVRSIKPCFVSISAREYEALRDIISNPTPENVERARKRVEIILNEVLNQPNHQRSVTPFGVFDMRLPPQKNYSRMLSDFLNPPPKTREVIPPRH
ncbi:hypothetical protein HY570_04420 [Candidatus Micrarchaeota archaeon]|nr:hypothetical protein [Candidatus Micrarchaeota archaeon]